MRKYITLLLCVVIGCMAHAQTGSWSGKLDVRGNKLPLVFHFDESNPTMDSPAQGAKGIPIQITKGDGGEIVISIPFARASFQGKVEDNKMEGVFQQNGLTLPLTLTPGAEKARRPQTPSGKGPYSEEEVSFANGEAILKGTLTLPEGYERNTPALIMVTGSGLQNRDEEISGHKPFAVIADALARNGIATLRYDDRGFGESTGDAVNCTTEDLMQDALAGIDLLRQRFANVGVLGHSEGGTIALMLAADGKTDFIVSLAGMVVSGKETLLAQNRLALTEAGMTEKSVDDYCRLLSAILDNDEDIQTQLESSELPTALKQNLPAVMRQMQTPYMRYFVALDMRDRLGKISCPVLALNGTKDCQVDYEPNLRSLNEGLPANSHNRIEAAEGLNHLFQHCTTGSVMEYGTIEETISPEILSIIAKWIKNLQTGSGTSAGEQA